MYRLTLLARLRLENQVAVVTGGAATAIFAKAGPNLPTELVERTPEIVQPWIAERCPIGRSGLPADNANAALWLASSESSFVTGHALVVDGGITAGRRWSEQHQLDERLTERFRSAMAQT
jgi:enoyl-[acyl-carrier-protein] reductase (NADH)